MKASFVSFILFLGVAHGSDRSDAIKDLVGLPDLIPLQLPQVPDMTNTRRADSQQQSGDYRAEADKGTPVAFPRNTLFYTRRKEGTGFFTFRSPVDCVVKVVDTTTRRVEAYFWMNGGTSFDHDYAPDSDYVIYFVQNVRELKNGNWIGEWFGKISDPFFV